VEAEKSEFDRKRGGRLRDKEFIRRHMKERVFVKLYLKITQ